MLDSAVQALYRRRSAPMADRGTIMNVISWMLLAIVVCTLITRFAIKLSTKTDRRKFGLDDCFIGLAAIFSFGETITVFVESLEVLGQQVHELTAHQLLVYQKAEYVACILYIANMGCARISVCFLIIRVLPGIVPRYTALFFAGFTTIWTVAGILAAGFACSLPNPWHFVGGDKCFNVVAFVNYIGITNVVLDVILVMIPLVVWNIRTSTRRRASVSLVFLARLSIVAAVSAQLYFFNKSTLSDFGYDCWAAVLCQQIAQNLAIISACLPCFHPFIIGMLAGTIQPDTVSFCKRPQRIGKRLNRSASDSMSSRSSHASISPLTGKFSEPYCRPLATWGLDSSSLHRHSHSATRFLPNIASKPIFTPEPPRNVFNRLIDVPQSRPATSTSTTDPLSMPPELRNVGVLPFIDWDTESSISDGSRKGSPSRQPTAEYVFNRQKVISVPEGSHLYDDGAKRFAPPLPSPRVPKRPPRSF